MLYLTTIQFSSHYKQQVIMASSMDDAMLSASDCNLDNVVSMRCIPLTVFESVYLEEVDVSDVRVTESAAQQPLDTQVMA